jgi:BlaI family penicillinase repressor
MTQISDAEAQVMAVLWEARVALSAEEIAAQLQGRQTWQLVTVKTLLNRLLKKGAITAVPEGRRYRYSPVLQRDACARKEASSLLDRWFGGSLAPLVAQFGGERPLRPDEVEALQTLLKAQAGSPVHTAEDSVMSPPRTPRRRAP